MESSTAFPRLKERPRDEAAAALGSRGCGSRACRRHGAWHLVGNGRACIRALGWLEHGIRGWPHAPAPQAQAWRADSVDRSTAATILRHSRLQRSILASPSEPAANPTTQAIAQAIAQQGASLRQIRPEPDGSGHERTERARTWVGELASAHADARHLFTPAYHQTLSLAPQR